MSELPKGWSQEALENLVEPRSERVSPADRPNAPYIGLEHVQAHTNKILQTVPASTMASSSAAFEVGDVLYGRMRPYLNKVVKPKFSGLASAEFIVFPESEALDSSFLLKRLSSADFVDFACSQYEGDRPRVKFDALGKFRFDLPPRAEQGRIVEKIEELLSDLDAGVAELKTAQKKLAQYRQSLLKAAVEGALTADWRAAQVSANATQDRTSKAPKPNHPTETGAQLLERILTERRARWEAKQLAKFKEQGKTPPKDWQKRYAEPAAPLAKFDLSIPDLWEWTGIEQLADGTPHGLKAGPFGSALKKEFYTPTGYKVYGQEQVIKGDAHYGDYFISTDKYEELISCATKPGDLLISLVGTTGKILVLPENAHPGIINPRLLKVSVSPGNISPAYIQIVLESPYARHFFKMNAHGGTMDVLNLGILKELAIPLPPLMEQQEIVTRLNQEFESISEQLEAIDHGLKQSTAQRQNILRAAFSGQLVPQDPNDEPASALLDRIRAERAMSTVIKSRKGKPKIGVAA